MAFYDVYQPISLYIGAIGCGKTWLITKLVKKYSDKGVPCFHNVDSLKIGYYLPVNDLIRFKLPRGSLYFLDEGGAELNNRNWKQLDKTFIKVFKYTRHDGVYLSIFSQYPDVDCTVTRLVKFTYFLKKFLWFTTSSKWKKDIIPPTIENRQTDFTNAYKKINFIPHIEFRSKKYFEYYDSFSPIPNDDRVPYQLPERNDKETK